ncbi:MAG: NUDIX domain-containing protein [Bacteroidetes bacterium]|nr:NUDIX domain-containing protein [Bacteroidota bacterium]
MQLHTAGLVVIKDKKLLLAYSNNKQAFYLPGGKVDKGETAPQALIREIMEELNIVLEEERLQYYTHITAPAYGENKGIIMEQDCYRYELEETPSPNAEIGSVEYFDSRSYPSQPAQVPGVIMILEQLKRDGLVN